MPIREPWISLVLGRPAPPEFLTATSRCLPGPLKDIEIRGKNTNQRGSVGLIASTTGTVVGVANLVEVLGPLTLHEYASLASRHCVRDVSHLPYRTTYGYVFADVIVFDVPAQYTHRSGAVTWCVLDDAARSRIAERLKSGTYTSR